MWQKIYMVEWYTYYKIFIVMLKQKSSQKMV